MTKITKSHVRIVLGNSSLATYPEGGGHWSVFLQYLLGLRALGHDVFWLELLTSTRDAARDQQLVAAFFDLMQRYGLKDCCGLLLYDAQKPPARIETATEFGRSKAQIVETVRNADVLWNFCGSLTQPILSLFKRRVFVDLDPGIVQLSAQQWDMGFQNHEVMLSVGRKLHDPDCEVPTLGYTWHRFSPFVYLPMWEVKPDPGPQAPFTSITQWSWDEIWVKDRILSLAKRDSYFKYVELPVRTRRPFELAANIHPHDRTGDRELLQSNGWRLVDPHEVAGSPAAYQRYLAMSRGEICCPKPIYRELNTGWFSDRSAGYLASGRPVLAEDTGFSDYFPTGTGLIAFNTMDEARSAVAEIDSDYARHSRAARGLVEEFMDSQKCLPAMLAACA